MNKKFESITYIDSPELFKRISAYTDELINEATVKGALRTPEADNVYTREIGRVGNLCADYERDHYESKTLRFKSPLTAH